MLLYAKFNSNKFEGISEMQIKGREDVNVDKKKKGKKKLKALISKVQVCCCKGQTSLEFGQKNKKVEKRKKDAQKSANQKSKIRCMIYMEVES